MISSNMLFTDLLTALESPNTLFYNKPTEIQIEKYQNTLILKK